jgi:hypothetical protein
LCEKATTQGVRARLTDARSLRIKAVIAASSAALTAVVSELKAR